MALKLQNYKTVYGINAQHWVIQSMNINSIHKYADITLGGYIDEEAYLNGATPIEVKKTKVYEKNGFNNTFSKKAVPRSNNIYAMAYEQIKSCDPFFKDAIDV